MGGVVSVVVDRVVGEVIGGAVFEVVSRPVGGVVDGVHKVMGGLMVS